MKGILMLSCLILCLAGCVGSIGQWGGVASNTLKAVSVSDEDLKAASMQMRANEDRTARVAPENSAYAKRLKKIMAKETSVNGVPLNYKVYMTPEINANATPDGSVRVYSGLMDKMNDDELRFVLGHEIGHVALGHSMNRMRMAYMSEAARQAIGNIHPTAGALSQSQLGELGKQFVNAQFSQSQESDADKYGLEFLRKNNYNTAAAGSALRKLADLGGSSSLVSQMFSSHPDSRKRAEAVEAMARGGNAVGQ